MNTVNEDNFNLTMEGYVDYALKFMIERLEEEGYSEKQIKRIKELFRNGLRWAKDDMTMKEARRYAER